MPTRNFRYVDAAETVTGSVETGGMVGAAIAKALKLANDERQKKHE